MRKTHNIDVCNPVYEPPQACLMKYIELLIFHTADAEAISQKISQIMSLPSAQLGRWPVALY